MRHYRRTSHTVYQLTYHFVFITKYRKPVLRGEMAEEVRDGSYARFAGRTTIEILKGHIAAGSRAFALERAAEVSPSRVMQAVKGKTSHHLTPGTTGD